MKHNCFADFAACESLYLCTRTTRCWNRRTRAHIKSSVNHKTTTTKTTTGCDFRTDRANDQSVDQLKIMHVVYASFSTVPNGIMTNYTPLRRAAAAHFEICKFPKAHIFMIHIITGFLMCECVLGVAHNSHYDFVCSPSSSSVTSVWSIRDWRCILKNWPIIHHHRHHYPPSSSFYI